MIQTHQPGTLEYTYTDSNTYQSTFDVSNISDTIEVILEGAKGGNTHNDKYDGTSYGGEGAYVVASIDLSPYDTLDIYPGQSGQHGGNGLYNGGSGAGGFPPGADGGGSTEIWADGERLVYAGAGGGARDMKYTCCENSGGGGAPGGGASYGGSSAEGTGNGGKGGRGNNGYDGGTPDDSEIPSTVSINRAESTTGGSTGDEDGNGVIKLFNSSN